MAALSLISASLVVMISLVLARVTLQAEDQLLAVNGITYSILLISFLPVTLPLLGAGHPVPSLPFDAQTRGKSVAVIEREARLGGHTETFPDSQTGPKIELGVVVFHNTTLVSEYFKRLNVDLARGDIGRGDTKYADFRTGKLNLNYAPVNPHKLAIAIGTYVAQLSKYPYLETGFNLPDSVPSDLLLPFGDIVKEHELEGLIANFIHLQEFRDGGHSQLWGGGFVTAALDDSSLLYEHALAELGNNAFLKSKILQVDRSGSDVRILVQTQSGKVLIKSQKLFLTVPPKLDNLQGWDLSQSETKLFKQFGNPAYFTAVVRNTGIPNNISSVVNVGVDTLYNLPTLSGIYSVRQTGAPGSFLIKFGSAREITDAEVQNGIRRAVRRLQLDGKEKSDPELAVCESHSPFELTVSARAIASGFYRELYGLQGQRHTYYTGAAFHTHDSSLLWQYTEALLPSVTGELVTTS